MIYIIGIMLICSVDYRPNIKTYEVDTIELNHKYDEETTNIHLHQLIFWKFIDEPTRKNEKFRVVVAWRILPIQEYQEKLTEEEYRQKNKEFQDEWVKKYGINSKSPNYNPKFIGGVRCPRYDYKRKKWVVILYEKRRYKIIYSTSYFESWTTNDPEVDNQEILPADDREGLK